MQNKSGAKPPQMKSVSDPSEAKKIRAAVIGGIFGRGPV